MSELQKRVGNWLQAGEKLTLALAILSESARPAAVWKHLVYLHRFMRTPRSGSENIIYFEVKQGAGHFWMVSGISHRRKARRELLALSLPDLSQTKRLAKWEPVSPGWCSHA